MNCIKFSHKYPKLWNQNTALLLQVCILNRKNMDKDLIEYDTKYDEGKYYPLPNGTYLQLVFLGNKNIPFCTIRRWTPNKDAYYNSLIGKEFEIVINEEGDLK